MIISRKDAIDVLDILNFPTAQNWSLKKLNVKINNLGRYLLPLDWVAAKSKASSETEPHLSAVYSALEMQEEITVEGK